MPLAAAHRELLAEDVTLARVARLVGGDERPFVLRGRWAGGGAVAGSRPVRVLGTGEDPFAVLDEMPAIGAGGEAIDGMVGGGWFGLLGFALGARVERLPTLASARGAVGPDAVLAFYDNVLRLDAEGRLWFEALRTPAREASLDHRAAELRSALAGPQRTPKAWAVDRLDVMAPGLDGHADAVAAVVERIGAGEVFQVSLSLRMGGRLRGSALEAWLALMARGPAAYGAFVAWDGGAVLSASPESFLRRRGRAVVSAPMKGTRPRLQGDEQSAAAALAAAPKDAAEHVMIVDLVRNDLGRVCEYGSVTAGPREVEAHPGVWQMVTRVRGHLREEVGDAALVRACFPPGSVVGAPKVQALKVIAAEEATARGAHCGVIGYASPLAGLELSVAIRTLEVTGDDIALGVGGGIVADSDPAAEVQECLDKATPLLAALGLPPPSGDSVRQTRTPSTLTTVRCRPDPSQGVFETVAVERGRPVRVDAHLARLATSARALGFPSPAAGRVEAEVARVAATGASAVNVFLAADGHARVAARGLAIRDGPVELRPVLLPGGLGAHKWRDRAALEPQMLICDRGGEVLEGAWATVWALSAGVLLTPLADGRILPGVTRAAILEDPGAFGHAAAREQRLSVDDLRQADAILLSSALSVLVPARLTA